MEIRICRVYKETHLNVVPLIVSSHLHTQDCLCSKRTYNKCHFVQIKKKKKYIYIWDIIPHILLFQLVSLLTRFIQSLMVIITIAR